MLGRAPPRQSAPIPSHHPDGGPARVRTRTPRVLVVGAYERDNFGDLLFLLVTERYLAEAEVVAAAPFAADMTALLDRRIHAYGPLLQREAFDVIWTAGGQVGALDVERAYRMSAPPAAYRGFRRRSRRGRERILQRAVGGAPVVSPYIPSTAAYPRNAGAVTVLDSAGLSGIAALEPAAAGRARRAPAQPDPHRRPRPRVEPLPHQPGDRSPPGARRGARGRDPVARRARSRVRRRRLPGVERHPRPAGPRERRRRARRQPPAQGAEAAAAARRHRDRARRRRRLRAGRRRGAARGARHGHRDPRGPPPARARRRSSAARAS